MATKINSTKSVNEAPQLTDAELNEQIKQLGEVFSSEKTREIAIPVHYQKHVGPTWFVGINGVSMNIPVDGKKYALPESFATLLQDAMNNLTT
jgi:anti-sigma factor RsiW